MMCLETVVRRRIVGQVRKGEASDRHRVMYAFAVLWRALLMGLSVPLWGSRADVTGPRNRSFPGEMPQSLMIGTAADRTLNITSTSQPHGHGLRLPYDCHCRYALSFLHGGIPVPHAKRVPAGLMITFGIGGERGLVVLLPIAKNDLMGLGARNKKIKALTTSCVRPLPY